MASNKMSNIHVSSDALSILLPLQQDKLYKLQQQILHDICTAAHYESDMLGNLSLSVKKVLTLTGDVKPIFKLQDVNLTLNNFLSFFRI